MATIAPRASLTAFALANPFYAGASVTVLAVDRATWTATTTKATLYAAASGTTEVGNPIRLDGDGKFLTPVYVDGPVVMRITGTQVPAHDTGVTGQTATFRDEWATATSYQIGDLVRDGEAGANTGSLYLAASAHQSGVWADDLAGGLWALYLDATDAGALRAINNLSDVENVDAARQNLGAAAQEDLDAAEVVVEQANADRIVSASVDSNGMLILTKLSGDTLEAGYVVGPPGDVSVVGTPQGTWDADTNTPALSDGSGSPGDAYIVAVAGTTTIDGVSSWGVGDTIYRGASAWERIPANPTPGAFTELTVGDITIYTDGATDGGAVIADAYGEIIMRFADAETLLKGFTVGANGPVFASATMDEATITELTATAATIAGEAITETDGEAGHAVADAYGEIQHLINLHGAHWPGLTLRFGGGTSGLKFADPYGEVTLEITSTGSVKAGGIEVYMTDGPAGFAFGDEYGELFAKFDENGAPSGFGASGGGTVDPLEHSDEEIDARNGVNLGASASLAAQQVTGIARVLYELNHFILYGQSLSTGAEGTPYLSTTTKYDNLMFGGAVRPTVSTSVVSTWVPVTGAAFNDLEATDIETVMHGALNTFRRFDLASRSLLADADRRCVGSSAGIGGVNISQLQKGATPTEIYNRLVSLMDQAHTQATTDTLTYGVTALLWMQGESNQTTGKSSYLTALRDIIADFRADAITETGQADPPAVFMYQTTAPNWNFDNTSLGVQMAQLEVALNDAGCFMVGPNYPYPDSNNLHLVANSYRWLGSQFGKVMHHVLTLGRAWKPLHATRATLRGREILIDYHVPAPPLVFASPWLQDGWFVGETTTGGANTEFDQVDKGFSVLDSTGGYASISTVELVSETQVRITLADTPATGDLPLYVRFADGVHYGHGSLRDSDPTVADDVWEHTGGQADADINADLVDAAYPLHNWAVSQQITVETLA